MLEFKDIDMAMALNRCLIVILIWVLIKLGSLTGIKQIDFSSWKGRGMLFAMLGIDILMFGAMAYSPNSVAALFGEPFLMRQHTI